MNEPWVPYFETLEVMVAGSDWPSYVVERWERNQIGETRFTGQALTYHPPGRPLMTPSNVAASFVPVRPAAQDSGSDGAAGAPRMTNFERSIRDALDYAEGLSRKTGPEAYIGMASARFYRWLLTKQTGAL